MESGGASTTDGRSEDNRTGMADDDYDRHVMSDNPPERKETGKIMYQSVLCRPEWWKARHTIASAGGDSGAVGDLQAKHTTHLFACKSTSTGLTRMRDTSQQQKLVTA